MITYVAVALIALSGCKAAVGAPPPPPGLCAKWAYANGTLYRCESPDTICYAYGSGLQCWRKNTTTGASPSSGTRAGD